MNTAKILDLSNDPYWSNLIAYTHPNAAAVRELSSYLKRYKYDIEYCLKLYHGTCSNFDILDEGLKPTTKKTAKSYQSTHGYVYLSIYPDTAQTFGEIAYPMIDISVYSVTIPIRRALPDHDQLFNQRLYANRKVGATLAESLAYGHGCRVKGWVPPYMIALYKQIKYIQLTRKGA